MRPLPQFVPSVFLFVVVGCASNEASEPLPPFAVSPMPMVEAATPMPVPAPVPAMPAPAPIALTAVCPGEIEHTWTDSLGRRWQVAFRCRYASDSAHEQLAAATAQANWLRACELTRETCTNGELDTFEGIASCERRLQRQLDEILFPCDAGALNSQVTAIEWTAWIVEWQD
ncbi:MAG: hypothetical protein WAT39_08630 [Planctomycetota bacterium]